MSYSSGGDSVAAILIYVVLILAAVVGAWQCNVYGCERACKLDGASYEYVIGNGCYCKKDGKAYNPADSR